MLALIGVLAFALGALVVLATIVGAAGGSCDVLRDMVGLFKEAALLARDTAKKH